VELWVHQRDAAAAERILAEMEATRGANEPPESVGTPED
jgi:hypothetical protein